MTCDSHDMATAVMDEYSVPFWLDWFLQPSSLSETYKKNLLLPNAGKPLGLKTINYPGYSHRSGGGRGSEGGRRRRGKERERERETERERERGRSTFFDRRTEKPLYHEALRFAHSPDLPVAAWATQGETSLREQWLPAFTNGEAQDSSWRPSLARINSP